jgi:SRSO17 transposase
MIGQALAVGVPAAWVAGDEVYGPDPGSRDDLEARHVGYVLAVAKDRRAKIPSVATWWSITTSAPCAHAGTDLGAGGRRLPARR